MREGSRESGFTLIEVLVVIVIIGLMASIVAMRGDSAVDEARLQKARADVENIYSVVTYYYTQKAQLPVSLDELVAPQNGQPPYLRGYTSTPKDPWDTEYALIEGDNRYDWQIVSFGPDRMAGTDDDISSNSTKEN